MSINFNKKACVIDIGHGGSDSGACANGLKEKDCNLDTGLATIKELERHGIKVYSTRVVDKYLSINERCNIANKCDAQYFISIHHNAGGGDRGETIHSILEGDGKDLAIHIGNSLKAIGQTTIKTYDREYNNNDYYGVIRGTKMHAVIVEVAFLDNAKDVQLVDTFAERQRNGIAIAHGILKEMGVAIKPFENPNQDPNLFYRVIVGSYNDKQNAINMQNDLKKDGYGSFLEAYRK